MVSKTNYRLMQVKRIEDSAKLSTLIKLLFDIKIFVLSILMAVLYGFYCAMKFYNVGDLF